MCTDTEYCTGRRDLDKNNEPLSLPASKKENMNVKHFTNSLYKISSKLFLMKFLLLMPCPSDWIEYFLPGTKSDLFKTN